jgi:hypothetical protein
VSGPEGSHHLTLSLLRNGASWDRLVQIAAHSYLDTEASTITRVLPDYVRTVDGLGMYVVNKVDTRRSRN